MRKILFFAVLCLSATSVIAKEITHKDWVINTDGPDYFYAATVNKSGHVFGKYCYFESEQCLYLTGVDITCTTGNKYPVLINADSGSLHATLHCGDRLNGQNVLVFDNFDEVEATAKDSKQIGIAIPMENGRFKVSRFSMSGSTYSLDTMTEEAEKYLAESNVDSEFL
ncbi:hypothetical protein BCS95_11810 [Vibrio breoganii]|uniref:hypothetical protein n=1 Tax=Vibrio breoganii TaxID=553239 RepID=UPI000C82892A|nr:hypothetical protein [Vibrio breoganii]PMP02161.1 hypothetical protein BCS95_11810 [Vibrio breoganii]